MTKSVAQPAAGEQKSIKWSEIHIPDTQVRSDLPEIAALAAELKENGQLVPIVVENGGPEGKPYTLVAGARRMEAFRVNGWEDREILAVVRQYKAGDPLGRIHDQWNENVREAVHPFDLGEYLHHLVEGKAVDPRGNAIPKVDRKELAARLSITNDQLGKYIRVHSNIPIEVAKLARKHDVPIRRLYYISSIKGDTSLEKDAQVENQIEKQMAVVEDWIAQQKELAEAGRSRGEREDKGKKRGEREKEVRLGVIRWKTKLGPRGTSFRHPAEGYVRVLEAKKASTTKEEALQIQGALAYFRFFAGELKKPPFLKADDFDILLPEEEEEEEADEEEEEAE